MCWNCKNMVYTVCMVRTGADGSGTTVVAYPLSRDEADKLKDDLTKRFGQPKHNKKEGQERGSGRMCDKSNMYLWHIENYEICIDYIDENAITGFGHTGKDIKIIENMLGGRFDDLLREE